MGFRGMNVRMITGIIILVMLFTMCSNVTSQDNHFNWDEPIPPRLFLDYEGANDGYHFLAFVEPGYKIFKDQHHWRNDAYFYYRYDGAVFPIGFNESITLVINDVVDRYIDPNIESEICLNTNAFNFEGITLDAQLRCDGNNDGNYEYLISFSPIRIMNTYTSLSHSYTTSGQPLDMNHGTIELILTRTDGNPEPLNIETGYYTYIQIPFDLDTDGDGTTDYSDPDNDNDGHNDRDDMFPYNPSEWKDSDLDGIGDNEDDDDNDNRIPDIFEIPIAIGIVLIPILVIVIMVKHMKKKGSEKEDGSKTIVYKVKYSKPPRKYRKIPRKVRKDQRRLRKIQRKYGQ